MIPTLTYPADIVHRGLVIQREVIDISTCGLFGGPSSDGFKAYEPGPFTASALILAPEDESGHPVWRQAEGTAATPEEALNRMWAAARSFGASAPIIQSDPGDETTA